MTVFRCFVEKKPAYAVEAKSILNDLHVALRNQKVEAVRVLNRYVYNSFRATGRFLL